MWTFDSHLLWQEPYVIYSQILAETQRVMVGPMVTNPATRDWTVTASVFATLNEMYGNRTVVRHRPRRLGGARHQRQADHAEGAARGDPRHPRARQLAGRSSTTAPTLQFPWSAASELEVWVAAYGPLALKLTGEVGDGFILQLADVDIAKWMISTVRDAAEDAGRDPDAITFCVAAPMYIGDGLASTCATSAAGSAAWSATTSPTSSPSTATTARCPQALTDYIAGREGYDYNEHGQAGNTHADFVPDEIVDRFCMLGTAEEHIAKLEAAQGDRRRPVRRLPPARQQGGDPARLRRDGHPGAARPRDGEGLDDEVLDRGTR